jgi:FAD/FMN-containing dehydrogenase
LFEADHEFYCLIEVAGNNDPEVVPEDTERLYSFIESVQDYISDGLVPSGEEQTKKVWDLRENVAAAGVQYGFCLKYDVSLGSSDFYKIVEETKKLYMRSTDFTAAEKDSIRTVGYGHIGDGNLHLNVSIPGHEDKDLQMRLSLLVEPFVMNFVREARGSISAEHGVGLQKVSFLEYSKSQPMIEYMKRIKNVFDPNGIMNPYKVL